MPFRLKTILGIALIEGIILSILIFLALFFIKASSELELKEHATSTVNLFATALQDAVITTDLDTINSFLQEVKKNRELAYVRVIGTDSIILGELGNERGVDNTFKPDFKLENVDDNTFDVSASISEAGTQFGRIELGISADVITEYLLNARGKIIYVAIVGMVLSALFSFFLGSYLLKQLKKLEEAAGMILSGDYTHKIEVKGNDEIAKTALSFNKMVDKLNETFANMKIEILERKKATETAEAANLAKSQFLANMSHEIRTPMNGIIGITALMLHSDLTEKQRKYLLITKTSSDNLMVIINDILDISKIESGKIEVDYVDFNFRDTLDDLLDLYSLHASEKALDFFLSISPDVPDMLIGDPGRLRQILINLLSNAIKFTHQGYIDVDIKIESIEEKRIVINIMIGDTGIGISNEKRDVILEPFMQADNTMSKKYGGTGLGLSISAELACLLGGRLWFDSMEGMGSKFHLTVAFDLQDKITEYQACYSNQLENKSVLVLEKNEKQSFIVEKYLNSFNVKSFFFETPGKALAFLKSNQELSRSAAILVSDRMPGMEGDVLLKQIEVAGQHHDKNVILTSDIVQSEVNASTRNGVFCAISRLVKDRELFNSLLAYFKGTQAEKILFSPVQQAEKHRLKILLVEDELLNQQVAVSILSSWGHFARVANNGMEALNILKMERFDLILMDLQMPGMDGLQATQLIRERERRENEYTPVIAVTAHALKGDRDRCLSAGIDDYVTKPIRGKELHDAIGRLELKQQAVAASDSSSGKS